MSRYFEHCDSLYMDWQGGETFGLQKPFDPEFAPEPYLLFEGAEVQGRDRQRLVFLTTNPGPGVPYQKRPPCGVANSEPYAEFQKRLAECYYPPKVLGGTAGTRIVRMKEIYGELVERKAVKPEGFVQCEMIPFHSQNLPNKARYIAPPVVAEYWSALREFLSNHHVIALDSAHLHHRAAKNRGALVSDSQLWDESGWLFAKAGLYGLSLASAKDLKRSSSGHPSIRLYRPTKQGALIRGHCLTDGMNSFPKKVLAFCDALLE